MKPNPKARDEQIIVEQILDETLVYDLKRHKGHRLNRTAAAIWRRCDGQTTVAEMAASLPELGLPADAELVRYTLARLEGVHLLHERVTPRLRKPTISRREILSKLAQGGSVALLLPVVSSIAAPTPAMAASPVCVEVGDVCGEVDVDTGECSDDGRICCPGLTCTPHGSISIPCTCESKTRA